ncbi:hypothetical protein WH96_05440 [Kiloniella spongiae]|uniref:Uncharacterized protein n=1 Tax=Kiloniella spongiae TaxID=1489064 RepID=A0A0H2MHS5_9PROT|nr:DUF6058 family natural product biosynthesis protein [Kiloniella spongiae]KLN61746.1 hypothetical protein WH96_05440 [Kiloniella spongiae]
MLLNYLYENFYEEASLLKQSQVSQEELRLLISQRIAPQPSYVITANLKTISFVSQDTLSETCRFYPKTYPEWLNILKTKNLDTEDIAKNYFRQAYQKARQNFFESEQGKDLLEEYPALSDYLTANHFNETWNHFLGGVFGVCTRENLPRGIFEKQLLVRFIDYMKQHHSPANISPLSKSRLETAVAYLNMVEADFAPHEVPITSRQRCINDVRKKYRI